MKFAILMLIAASHAASLSAVAFPQAAPATVRVGGDVKPPIKTKNVPPVYPPIAHQNHIQGVVILDITIGTDGKVKDTKTLRSPNSLLENAAITAVRAWEYKPTEVDGKPVQVIMTVPVNFVIE